MYIKLKVQFKIVLKWNKIRSCWILLQQSELKQDFYQREMQGSFFYKKGDTIIKDTFFIFYLIKRGLYFILTIKQFFTQHLIILVLNFH